MKKIIKISLICLLLFTSVACGKKKTEEKKEEEVPQTVENVVENKTESKQGDIELNNVEISANGSMNIVKASIKNTGKSTKTFKAVLYLKTELGLILGKIEQDVENLAPDTSKEVSVEIMGDYTTVDEYQLIIENLIEE